MRILFLAKIYVSIEKEKKYNELFLVSIKAKLMEKNITRKEMFKNYSNKMRLVAQ